MTDLFGNPITDQDFKPARRTKIRDVLGPLNYRPAEGAWRCGNCARFSRHRRGRI